MNTNRRKVIKLVRGSRAIDGAGVHLTRVLGHKQCKTLIHS